MMTLACAGCPSILIDHNYTGAEILEALRKMGYIVKSLDEAGFTGKALDKEFAKWAIDNGYWILTKDADDFVELGFRNLIKVPGNMTKAEMLSRMQRLKDIAPANPDQWMKSVPLGARAFAPPAAPSLPTNVFFILMFRNWEEMMQRAYSEMGIPSPFGTTAIPWT